MRKAETTASKTGTPEIRYLARSKQAHWVLIVFIQLPLIRNLQPHVLVYSKFKPCIRELFVAIYG